MSFSQLVAILLARWKVVSFIFLVTVAATFVVTKLMPKQYLATASFVLESRDTLMGANAAPSNYLNTQLTVISSDRVARRVVRNLKLAEAPSMRGQWNEATGGKGDLEAWVATLLLKNLSVAPAGKSNVIEVQFKGVEPRFCAMIANAFVQAYIDTSLDLRVDPAKTSASFFDTRAKQYREDLERAQSKLSAYQKETGITVTDEKLDVETARLNALAANIVGLQALASETGSRAAQAGGASADRSPDVMLNPMVSSLQSELSRQEVALQQLNARFGDNHPQVVEVRASIGELKARLQSEMKRASGTAGVNNTIVRKRESDTTAAFDAQRSKVLKLKSTRDEIAMLQREVENAQRVYDAVVNRLTTNNLESQNTLSNAYLLDAAVEPGEPSSPKVVKNMVFALVLGSILALATGLLLELLNRRVRSLEDISHSLGLPVIGVMPSGSGKGLLGRRATQPLLARQVLGQLPSPR
jgi:polysaccharide biosynthesis transport protein